MTILNAKNKPKWKETCLWDREFASETASQVHKAKAVNSCCSKAIPCGSQEKSLTARTNKAFIWNPTFLWDCVYFNRFIRTKRECVSALGISLCRIREFCRTQNCAVTKLLYKEEYKYKLDRIEWKHYFLDGLWNILLKSIPYMDRGF